MFLSVSPDAARGRVLAFLAFSLAPFLILARFIGPFLDRVPGGRRLTIVVLSIARAGLMFAIMRWIDSLSLFALMFVALVLAKVYGVSRSAVMPTVAPSDELMAANGQIGRLTGIVGIVAGGPAALLQLISSRLSLSFAAMCFVLAGILALSLPRGIAGARGPESDLERNELHSPSIVRAAMAMAALRVANGFLFFHLAFWLRTEKAGTAWFALALGIGSLSTLIANSIGGLVRRVLREHVVLEIALVIVAVVGLVCAYVGSITAGIVLTGVTYAVGALGKLAFDSILQTRAPDANRSRAFARYETRNQFAQVAGGFVAVGLTPSGAVGFAIIGSIGLIAAIYYAVRY
ncbi:MAG: hypothetical protein ACO321_03350 [Ilumatobacteraceae bacterium]|jgi:hypothetical protein